MTHKEPIIIFEGCDGSGKDTIINCLHKLTEYKYPIINRFTGSSYVYGKLRSRRLQYHNLFKTETIFSETFNVLLVYLVATTKDLEKRKDDDITNKDIKKIKKLYNRYLESTNFRFIVVDTSTYNPEKSASIIKQAMIEMGVLHV